MRRAYAIVIAALLASSAASAQMAQMMSTASGKTVTNWYKQTVYDPSDNTIGKIDDVLVSDAGQISGLVIGVGGFLGAGEKDVAVPFGAVKWTNKNNKTYLTMNATKDQLKAAPGLKYDSGKTAWIPDK